MTIRLHAITLHARPVGLAGSMALHDDTTGRIVTLRVLPTDVPPGYRVVTDVDADLPDWPVFVAEADRIITTLLTTADENSDRYAAVRTLVDGFPLARFRDLDFEHLLWRFIRGEIDTDGLRDQIAALDYRLSAENTARTEEAATTAAPDTSEGEQS